MKRLLLAALLAILLAGGYYFRGFFFDAPAETRAARPSAGQSVVADVVVEMEAPIEVTAIGTVQSIASVMVKSRIDGEITQVHFEEGQEVKEGDLLFSLDDRAARAQLRQSEANLERDRAQLQRFHQEVTRQTGLANRGVASTQKLEDTMTSEAVFEATVRAGEAAVETARVILNYTTIRAPITGRTGSVTFKRGNIVKAVDTAQVVLPLVTITQLRPIYVVFTIPERHLADLRTAQASGRLPVIVTIPDQPQSPVTGSLTFIDNQVDAATGTISLKATFANDDARLWPGQFVSVTLRLGTQANAIAAPSVGIQIGQNGPYVFLVKDDSTVELRLVRVGRTVGNKTVIADGACRRRSHRRRRPAPPRQRNARQRAASRGPCSAEGAARSRGGAHAMTLPTLCIERPVMTTLLTMAIVLVGGVGYMFLPVAALPQVDFPTIAVSTTLPGASPSTMAASIATPLEREFSAIAGIDSITSVSGLGIGRITVQFNLNRSIDAAAQDIQAAIGNAARKLPAEMTTPPSYRKVNPGASAVLQLTLVSQEPSAVDGQRICGNQHRPAAFHASRSGADRDFRSAEIRRSCPGRSRPARGPGHFDRRGPTRGRGGELDHAGRGAQRTAKGGDVAGRYPGDAGVRLFAADHRLSQRRAGAPRRRCPGHRQRAGPRFLELVQRLSAPSRSRCFGSPTQIPSTS